MARRFSVNADHLVKLCDAVLESKLDPARLEAIGFAMIGSDAFEWDVDVADGDRVADVLNQWASPEINYRLSLANVEKWKRFLKTGESTFTRVDLSP